MNSNWNENTALELARRLTLIPEFPQWREAVQAIAEDLMDMTENAPNLDIAEARARWLVETMRNTWDRWLGPRSMRELYDSRFNPPPPPSNAVQPLGAKPPIECQICNDTGVVRNHGIFDWCECQAGIHLHFDLPDWLDLLNRKPKRQPQRTQGAEPTNPNFRPITQADIDRALEDSRTQKASSELKENS